MLTRLRVRNLKRFEEADIELGKAVVFIGPNNSGKTTALQALALWDIGLRQWKQKRGGKASPEKRPGVTINRRDLIALPVPVANLLWRGTHVRNVERADGKTKTRNIRIDIEVKGATERAEWSCGLEFDYSNEESFVCRPLRRPGSEHVQVRSASFTRVPEKAYDVKVAYLPPMSGLAAVEPKWEPGRVNVLVGEGQTAQVLRNLCHQVHQTSSGDDWKRLVDQIHSLFSVKLLPPEYVPERGEITMQYEEHNTRLDLSCSGRGLQQTLLLLAHLYANPGTVLLLDEPDAHLEILRQRQIYALLSDVAEQTGSQIVAASHSEVVLNEAAGRDVVIAFVGKPHRIDKGSQVLKSLTEIGFDQYYQAEQTGWVLYLEDATDLAILKGLAETLGHDAAQYLDRPFVHYVTTNLPQRAREHFYGLREAKGDLVGFALFDRLEKNLQEDTPLVETMWRKNEIENYLCVEEALLAYAKGDKPTTDLFEAPERTRRENAMQEAIRELQDALATIGRPGPWSPDIKASDDFLAPLFKAYSKKLGSPLVLRKADYHELARLVPPASIDPEVIEKLDAIVDVAKRAKPRED